MKEGGETHDHPMFYFEVALNVGLEPTMVDRLVHHLKILDLADRFGNKASIALEDCCYRLKGLHDSGGPNEVEKYFLKEAESCAKKRLNYWKTASYYAAAESPWFCDEGFRMLGAEEKVDLDG